MKNRCRFMPRKALDMRAARVRLIATATKAALRLHVAAVASKHAPLEARVKSTVE